MQKMSKNIKDTEKYESSDTFATTETLRKKGERVKRFFITIVKCFRLCKKNKKTQNVA